MQPTNSMLIRFTFLLVLLCCIVSFYSSVMACDCDYKSGGCIIVKPAAPGNACHCVYEGYWTCHGEVVGCGDDHYSDYCNNPDKTVYSCLNGGGDCGGYKRD